MFSRTRAARILGRCHAAIGQHDFSVSALDAGLEAAKVGELLFSESLVVRARALVGKAAAAAGERSGSQWPAETGKQQGLHEVMERMAAADEGGRALQERLLLHGM